MPVHFHSLPWYGDHGCPVEGMPGQLTSAVPPRRVPLVPSLASWCGSAALRSSGGGVRPTRAPGTGRHRPGACLHGWWIKGNTGVDPGHSKGGFLIFPQLSGKPSRSSQGFLMNVLEFLFRQGCSETPFAPRWSVSRSFAVAETTMNQVEGAIGPSSSWVGSLADPCRMAFVIQKVRLR